MGLFDAIRGAFDPYTIEQFDYLYNHYYKALDLYIRGGYKHPINKMFESRLTHIYLSRDMSYDNKKFLVEMKDSIISSYNREIAFEKASEIMSKYPIGTTLICYKEFNITISDAPSAAKKALAEHVKNSFNSIYSRFGLFTTPYSIGNKNNSDKKWKPQTLTISEVLFYSENIVEKENSIREEERKLQEQINKWQKEADDKIVSDAKYLARFYPNGYKKLVNFPVESMSLGQAKTTLEYENRIKQYEKEYREREGMPSRVKQAVNNWETVKGIPHYFFYYYYPTRISYVSSTSEKARKMIWKFKNGEEKFEVSKILKEKLQSTFRANDLKEMTLVCIPASTVSANRNRYESFSQSICNTLGMKNGFPHISIVKEKEESHLGGTTKAEYRFDTSFFKGAHIVLFDDVVTRGHSIEEFKNYLTRMGANVVCAISIGRTCDESNSNVHPLTGSF